MSRESKVVIDRTTNTKKSLDVPRQISGSDITANPYKNGTS